MSNIEDRNHNFGIKRDSPFNKLKFFHVCNPGLPPCVAHDIYEGVLAADLMLFIHYFVGKKWFSYKTLNFYYNIFQKRLKLHCSFPAIQSNSKKLSGNATQNYNFLIVFPLIVNFLSNKTQIINFNDLVWLAVLNLLEITQIASAHAIKFSEVCHFNYIIQEYLRARKNLFSNIKLKPKHHYLSHYPQLTIEFGPLIKLFT